jgi:hypothetical protein
VARGRPGRNDRAGDGGVLGLHGVKLRAKIGGAASHERPEPRILPGVVMVEQVEDQANMLGKRRPLLRPP